MYLAKLEFQYSIIDTDYTNYAVAFACGTLPIVKTNVQLAWIYGRNRTLDQVYVDKAIAAMKAQNLNTSKFVNVTQVKCSN